MSAGSKATEYRVHFLASARFVASAGLAGVYSAGPLERVSTSAVSLPFTHLVAIGGKV